MEQIAFISGGTAVYWSSIVFTCAAAVAVCFFLSFYLGREGNPIAAFVVIPVSIALSLVLARFLHWYSCADSYDGFFAAMTDYTSGGYTLTGVFAGCLLAACLTRLVGLHRSLPQMLDCMCLAACPGIALGRLASFFGSADRGRVVENLKSMPWVYPVTNAVSGATEYRFATFLFQFVVALVLFGVLVSLEGSRSRRRDGDLCLLFFMLYGASQVVLDSTRYDSLYFRSNGFVSVVQVLGAVGLVLGIVVFSVRAVKNTGLRFWYVPVWIGIAAALTGAGCMEYLVQRRGSMALLAYSVMTACLALAIGMTLLLRNQSYLKKRIRR